ncbi:MAG: 30S ribosomal protein S20 [Candidatus Saccharimonadales bacterium]
MPIIKSARKRVKVSAKANVRNAKTKRSMREALKAFTSALAGGKPAEIAKAQAQAASAIDKATKKAVIHKNKAARKKAQLAARAKAAGVRPVKAVAKKATPKKAAAKKTTANSPAKKTAPKKSSKK